MPASLRLHSPWWECRFCHSSLPAGHAPAVVTWWVNMVAQISVPANTRCCFAELNSPVAAIYGSVILGRQRTWVVWTHFPMSVAMWINPLWDQWFWESSSVITTGIANLSCTPAWAWQSASAAARKEQDLVYPARGTRRVCQTDKEAQGTEVWL